MYSVRRDGPRVVYRDELEGVTMNVGAELSAGLARMEEPPAIDSAAYEEALRRPIGVRPLAELAGRARRACVIVPDSTRNAPSGRFVPLILGELRRGGMRLEDIVIIVAIGVHRPATPQEMDEIIGPEFRGRVRIVNHDPYTPEALVSLGRTSRGTPVEVNRTVYECDLRVGLAKVEPHEFAGFSGGRKLVLPGVAGEESIVANHRPEMILSPRASIGVLEGNPVSEDMEEAAALLGLHFVVNTVVDKAGEPIGVFAGDLRAAHLAAVDFLRSFSEVALQEQPDVVVTTPGGPLNINLYQSLKPVFAIEPVLARGGAIVLYTSCPEGVGSDDLLKPYAGETTPDGVIRRLAQAYRIQMDHALLLSRVQKRGIKLFATSPGVPAATFGKMFVDAAGSPQEALERAITHARKGGRLGRVLFFPQPQRTLPTLNPS
ncbi:MAG: nickel-dependent lactate racemase family protein [Bacillota bacterium]